MHQSYLGQLWNLACVHNAPIKTTDAGSMVFFGNHTEHTTACAKRTIGFHVSMCFVSKHR